MDIEIFNNNSIKILLFVLFSFAFLVLSQLKWNFNPPVSPAKLTQEVLIESMENIEIEAAKLNINPSSGFCESHLGKASDLEISCNKLTQNRCLQTNCCVFTSNNKCSAGSIEGATYKTDKNGELISMDHYYYQDKCFGKNCS